MTLGTTGCMVGPGDGEDIGNAGGPVAFSGFMTGPNETVYLYGLKGFNDWQYIGQTTSNAYAIDYFGIDWHHWSMNVTVPGNCWHYYGNGLMMAVIQARDAQGNPLSNFDEGFYDALGSAETLGELWDAKGNNADSIIIFGD